MQSRLLSLSLWQLIRMDWMTERGLHYNVSLPNGALAGYLINQKFFDPRTGLQSGNIDGRYFFLGEDCAGILDGVRIRLNTGQIWRLHRVPF